MPRTSKPQSFLLDTHIWLWLVASETALAPAAQEVARNAAATGALLISMISIWEIAMLATRGRISLGRPVMAWVEEALARSGATVEPLSPEIAVASCHLPGGFRSDPADEIIIATARVTGATLMTRDRHILRYALSGNLTTLSA
jgi:PIN domain nuclease of toxin-antitoxin system